MAASRCILAALVLIFVNTCSGETCEKPEVTHKLYTTTDGLIVANIAFIAEFDVKCRNGAKDLALYADVNGKVLPAVRSLDTSGYQVSWTEELSKAASGEYVIRIYDDEGYTALRKVQERCNRTCNILPPLSLLTVLMPLGTYHGAWVQSEFVAVLVAVLLWYFAYSSKMKLQA
ncbi:signal sequence receptor delta, putative [Ixodes scapularis]|uniref:Translocon-associated protein subunit delta n=1 Tax=Ixodes scapularis TaxID=6945 RepID=B7Q926_IXOSC|nr:signal sequence receptor delta, putative [Ixodes scapularis]|eukprot:XP_002405540.1 signal sequence receptor delta, putative [Ixodes scapularis]